MPPPPLFSRLTEQGGQHSRNQPYEKANRRVGISLQQKAQQTGNSKKADHQPDQNRNQQARVLFDRPDRVRQQLHNRLIYAKNNAEHAARNARQNRTQADKCTLNQAHKYAGLQKGRLPCRFLCGRVRRPHIVRRKFLHISSFSLSEFSRVKPAAYAMPALYKAFIIVYSPSDAYALFLDRGVFFTRPFPSR